MRREYKIYLAKTLNNRLTRKIFRTIIILSLLNKKIQLIDALINYNYIEIYIIFNEIIVFRIYNSLLL